ncbi:hypothetical protein FGO68_gene6648 [Halteria grandinella]|uniref:Uncharacterized protein n=1 Tax=Halteria grandinella TaxID=5974 RepID=A0A8J8SUG8_HALGN|nr:hypothetical protein FGO68_gene6648 [Halteria grandinella]
MASFIVLGVTRCISDNLIKNIHCYKGGNAARQVGHCIFMSIQERRQDGWNQCLQGVSIAYLRSNFQESPGSSDNGVKHIAHSSQKQFHNYMLLLYIQYTQVIVLFWKETFRNKRSWTQFELNVQNQYLEHV